MLRTDMAGVRVAVVLLAIALGAPAAVWAQEAQPPAAGSPQNNHRVLEVLALQVDHEVQLQGPFDTDPLSARLTELAAISTQIRQEPFEKLVAPTITAGNWSDSANQPLAWYRLEQPSREPVRLVEVRNEYGTFRLTLAQPRFLLVPAKATVLPTAAAVESPSDAPALPAAPLPAPTSLLPAPRSPEAPSANLQLTTAQDQALPAPANDPQSPFNDPQPPANDLQPPANDLPVVDHYKVYEVVASHCVGPLARKFNFSGAYGLETAIEVARPRLFAVPVVKLHDGTRHEVQHAQSTLTIYATQPENVRLDGTLRVVDQFGKHQLCICSADLLAVRSTARLVASPAELDAVLVRDVVDQDHHEEVRLQGFWDQTPIKAGLGRLTVLGTAVKLEGAPLLHPSARYTGYMLAQDFPEPIRTVRIWNQFGEQELSLGRPVHLLVPARVDGERANASGLDHYKCFVVLRSCCGETRPVTITDPDGVDRAVKVGLPKFFCIPVSKQRGDIDEAFNAPRNFLTLYDIACDTPAGSVEAIDQFGTYTLDVRRSVLLGLPSLQLEVFPPVAPSVLPPPPETSVSTSPRDE